MTENNYLMVNEEKKRLNNNTNHEIFKRFFFPTHTSTRKAFRHQKQNNPFVEGGERTNREKKTLKHARNERSNIKQLSEEVFYYLFSFVLFYLADSCSCPRNNRCCKTKLNITTPNQILTSCRCVRVWVFEWRVFVPISLSLSLFFRSFSQKRKAHKSKSSSQAMSSESPFNL